MILFIHKGKVLTKKWKRNYGSENQWNTSLLLSLQYLLFSWFLLTISSLHLVLQDLFHSLLVVLFLVINYCPNMDTETLSKKDNALCIVFLLFFIFYLTK